MKFVVFESCFDPSFGGEFKVYDKEVITEHMSAWMEEGIVNEYLEMMKKHDEFMFKFMSKFNEEMEK